VASISWAVMRTRPAVLRTEPSRRASRATSLLPSWRIACTSRWRGACTLAPGLTPRSVLEKFAVMQMIDVHLPTTDGRELVLTRYTEPEPELRLLLDKLKLELPAQPPPKITAASAPSL
jgi:hypothetical protein